MPDTHNTKNYFTDNGNELVVGGKLTFLENAELDDQGGVISGGGGTSGDIHSVDNVADSTATTVAALKDDFNDLLASLRNSGLLTQK